MPGSGLSATDEGIAHQFCLPEKTLFFSSFWHHTLPLTVAIFRLLEESTSVSGVESKGVTVEICEVEGVDSVQMGCGGKGG
jgi:hypothetical protein